MSPTTVTLTEYESTRVRLSDADARLLVAEAGSALVVGPASESGAWDITATQFVGSLTVGGLSVLIRPKIRPENLFLLLEVGLEDRSWRREAFDYATGFDLLPAMVSLFVRTVETTLARGVLRSYQEQQDRVVALRGRLDLAAQFRSPGLTTPLSCRYDEYTEDIVENRFLRSALRRAGIVPRVPEEDRRRLLRQLVALEGVTDSPVRADDLERITFTRLNRHYEPALRLARLLLDNLTVVDQRGRASASAFLVDMNVLFERFVTERLRRALFGRLEVRSQAHSSLDAAGRVPIRPDLEFRRQGRAALVGDIKYKLTGDGRGRTADYYQLLAYTTAYDLTDGVLIYCRADGGVPASSVTVRHAGKRLHLRAIDLSGSGAAVAAEVEELAEWIERQAASSSPT